MPRIRNSHILINSLKLLLTFNKIRVIILMTSKEIELDDCLQSNSIILQKNLLQENEPPTAIGGSFLYFHNYRINYN